MEPKVIIAAILGALIGAGTVASTGLPKSEPPRFTTLAECVLQEMKGRTASIQSWVVKACRDREKSFIYEDME